MSKGDPEMDADSILVFGIIIGALAIPSVIGAFSHGRPPTMAGILLFFGAVLVVIAFNRTPGGYSFEEIPLLFVSVLRELLS